MTLNNEIDNLIIEFNKNIKSIDSNDIDSLNDLKNKYLSRKGKLSDLFTKLGTVDSSERPIVGKKINDLKQSFSKSILEIENSFDSNPNKSSNDLIDLTLPGDSISYGTKHPITKTINEIKSIFSQIGFSVAYGPEIDDDYHNFEALNIPKHHPARDMQDTFFIQQDPDILLRTHTSSVQVRYLENNPPPLKILSPGRVYRNEAISSRSHCIFHQVEGIYVDENVSFADLKQMILYFTKSMFGKSKLRFRPSFFPFTEPSAEVDIYWGLETETDYRITKGTGWLEIMGCGMVDPQVLENCNIDSEKYTGYAFGLGIERIAMLIYQIPDIRLFFENDVRFLNQFK